MRTLPESSPTNIATSLAPAFLERMRSSVRLIMEPDELARRFGGQRQGQPLHTVYGGADIFKSGSAAKLSQLALSCLSTYAGDWATFCRALKLPGHERLPDQIDDRRRMLAGFDPQHAAPDLRLAYTLYERVCQRLSSGNSVVDMRVDFEDGFGYRAADVEDHFAQKAALEMAKGLQSGQLPPFIGIRIKPLTIESADRSLRTLDIFITTLAQPQEVACPTTSWSLCPRSPIPDRCTCSWTCSSGWNRKPACRAGQSRSRSWSRHRGRY